MDFISKVNSTYDKKISEEPYKSAFAAIHSVNMKAKEKEKIQHKEDFER